MALSRREDSVELIKQAEADVNHEIERVEGHLNAIPAPGHHTGVQAALTGRSAILHARALRESTTVQNLLAEDLEESIRTSTASLKTTIDTFTTASDRTANALATWTKVLAVATIALVLATGALVWVEWSSKHP